MVCIPTTKIMKTPTNLTLTTQPSMTPVYSKLPHHSLLNSLQYKYKDIVMRKLDKNNKVLLMVEVKLTSVVICLQLSSFISKYIYHLNPK